VCRLDRTICHGKGKDCRKGEKKAEPELRGLKFRGNGRVTGGVYWGSETKYHLYRMQTSPSALLDKARGNWRVG